MRTRRDFLSLAGEGLGLATVSSATLKSLLRNVEGATKSVAHLTPEEAASDEDYWAAIQNSFTVTRGIINLNNGAFRPSARIARYAQVPAEQGEQLNRQYEQEIKQTWFQIGVFGTPEVIGASADWFNVSTMQKGMTRISGNRT